MGIPATSHSSSSKARESMRGEDAMKDRKMPQKSKELLNRVTEISAHVYIDTHNRASLIAQLVKNPPVMQETLVLFLGFEDALEKG